MELHFINELNAAKIEVYSLNNRNLCSPKIILYVFWMRKKNGGTKRGERNSHVINSEYFFINFKMFNGKFK